MDEQLLPPRPALLEWMSHYRCYSMTSMTMQSKRWMSRCPCPCHRLLLLALMSHGQRPNQ
jgi:hypothetical protein